jgi:type IV pilus assembly protein PilV
MSPEAMNMMHQGKRLSRERGMTMIEALVALLVLSIGLLGVAALQMSSLRNTHAAHMRSQATALANDITDRMRANRTVAVAGAYNIALGTTPVTPASLADIDLAAWKASLAATFPSGDGAVAVDPVTNVAQITIQLDDSRGQDALLTFVTRTRL